MFHYFYVINNIQTPCSKKFRYEAVIEFRKSLLHKNNKTYKAIGNCDLHVLLLLCNKVFPYKLTVQNSLDMILSSV